MASGLSLRVVGSWLSLAACMVKASIGDCVVGEAGSGSFVG